ncbi:hypothetical protein [Kitasatospora cineracea]|uniref:hypothetical protein n=1 Tax=Kitasatospora cineracea TaxID=88074 RepID=UPI0033F0F389
MFVPEYQYAAVGAAKEGAPSSVTREITHLVEWGLSGARVRTGGMAYYSPYDHHQDAEPADIVARVLAHVREEGEWGFGPLIRLHEVREHIQWFPAASLPNADRP